MTRKYILGTLFIILAIVLFIAPFGVLIAYRYDDWIYHIDKTKIASAVIIGGMYAYFVFKGVLKKIAPLVSVLCTSAVMSLIMFLLKSIIVDLPMIFLTITVGLGLFIIFYKIGARLIEKAKIYNNEKVRHQARQDLNEDLNGIL